MRWNRIIILMVSLALFVPAFAMAAPTPPEQLAKQAVQKVLKDMDGRRAELRKDPQKLHALIDQDLMPLIDEDYMAQLILGRYWREATPKQRERFKTAFKNMMIHTYGSALIDFNDDVKIDYKPVHAPADAKNVTFKAVIHATNGQDVPVTLRLHLVNGQWKAYDGTVGSLSFVTNYRGQFNSQIRKQGLEKVIEEMEKRYNP